MSWAVTRVRRGDAASAGIWQAFAWNDCNDHERFLGFILVRNSFFFAPDGLMDDDIMFLSVCVRVWVCLRPFPRCSSFFLSVCVCVFCAADGGAVAAR